MTSIRAGSMPSSSRRDLQGDGVHALAHLGPAVADLDPAVVRRKRTTAPATSRKPLPSPQFLSPSPRPTALPAATRRVVVRAGSSSRQASAPPAAVVHDLARPPHVAGTDHVALADLPPADADRRGEPVEHALHARTGPGWRRSRGTLRTRGCWCARRPPRTSIAGTWYGPLACPAARSSTFMPTLAYGARVADGAHAQAVSSAVGVAAGPVLERGSGGAWRASAGSPRATACTSPGGRAATPRARSGPGCSCPPCRRRRRRWTRARRVTRSVPTASTRGDVVAVVPHALAAGVHVQRRASPPRRRHGERATPARGRRARCAASGTPRARWALARRARRRRRRARTR